jgi:hypothetical protein
VNNKKKIFFWGIVSFILTGIVVLISLQVQDKRTPVLYMIPNNYTGWVTIYFGQKESDIIEKQNNYFILKIPEDGILKIKNQNLGYGWAEDKYYYADIHGNKVKELFIEKDIFGHSTGSNGEVEYQRFFIGSKESFNNP